MGRGQLKGMWSQERIVYSMEDMNDASERETLTSQELTQREEASFYIWEEMGSRTLVEGLAVVQIRFAVSI